jgi:hypothetical protein
VKKNIKGEYQTKMGRKKKIKQQPIYYKRYLHNDGGYMAIKVEPIHHKKHLIEHNILTIRG